MRDLLWVLYLPAKQCVSSMSAHSLRVLVSHIRLLKWKTATFMSSGLRLQHPDLNPVNYISLHKNSAVGLSQKIHNVNWPTLWYGWHGVEQRIIDNVTDEWCKRLWACVYVKATFLVFNLTAYRTFVHFNVLVWWKLTWCYCVESPFSIFFTYHKVVWLHS